jgi:type II secretory ATPase GspE/PulE/Tfp pilus assembly ATPase PilB-like protein
MVIEDNLIYRELLRELCESEGHEVVETGRAEDALLMLKNYDGADVYNQERGIDLFIVDFNMDRMNGFELIRELRSMEKMSQAPILMISSTAKNMGDLLKTEGVAFLPKPSPNVLVMATIRNLLEKAGKARPAEPGARRAPARPSVASIMAAGAHAPAPIKPLSPTPPMQAPGGPRAIRDPFRRGPLPAMPIKAFKSAPQAPVPPAAVPPTPPPAQQLPTGPSHNALPPSAPSRPALPPIVPPHSAPPPEPRNALGSIDDGIKNHISQSSELTEFLISRQKPVAGEEQVIDAANSPVADLLEKILDSAIRQRASDIHIEPQAGALDVRLRVDGVLRPLLRLPTAVADNVVARIKIMSSLNITERRLPQDGQFIRNSAQGITKFRISTLPSMHGEKVVLRVLPSGSLQVDLEGIGFSAHDLELTRKVLRSPNGLILLTGPTGSGKTTTLYTMLESLNNGKRNITTVEDPVEYQLNGITQVQVNPAIGYTFERVLRSFLRQDPDVMLVGEIRDLETAEIALKAAATGHLVFTTLHTNNAASAVQRLLSMGLPSYLVAAATRLVIAQRLVRVLCPKCKAPGALTEDEACMLRPEEVAALQRVWRPVGCAACQGVGHMGRRVVMEALPVLTTKARMAISKGATPDEIEALGVEDGMSPMRRQALQLVADGIISAEEALTVLHV